MKSPRIVVVPRKELTTPEILQRDEVPLSADVVRAMPRRKTTHSKAELQVALPRARRVYFRATFARSVSRLLAWLWRFMQYYAGVTLDRLRRRSTVYTRAVRLRRAFEDGGPTFAKLAQQLSMRADMLPYAYCAELSKMLDQAEPFSTEEAIAIVERNLGSPLSEVFATFDPKPIGSASLACVYQAELHNGDMVAVKVRRPGIGPLIAADLRAMDWIMMLGETLTIIPPGATRVFRHEFENILFSELNFRAEARYTHLFRQRAQQGKRQDVTAPKVHFQYCTEEVMVSELISGVWMWELMAAVDANDQIFLAKVAEIGIEPKALARKLVRIMQREVQEELFFHADPHPANLVVTANNKICFLDFGAIGRFTTQTRKAIREFQYHMIRGDIGRLANVALTLLGPLPPMDVESIRHEFEKIYSDAVYAMKSDDAEWWEKSAAQGWLRFLEVARKFSIPASADTIKFFRTTFAYDAVIMRLDKNLDVTKEWEIYAKQAAKEARQRVRKRLGERRNGLTDSDYVKMEEFGDLVTQFFFQVQRNVENPIVHFRNIVGKIAYIMSLILKIGVWLATAIGLGLIATVAAKRWFDYQIDWNWMWERATSFGWVQLVVIAVSIVVGRRIIIRLNFPDTRLDPER
jgi:predicted unusual protein kinase regulating ubiquinone biosynthesis (AarF/ABC1/UbiB family)